MGALLLVGVLALNVFISWLNCKSVGSIWIESKKLGGYMRVLVWCGVIQSVVGFSSALIFGMGFVAYATGHLPQQAFQQAVSLWYLLIIFPALGSGLLITIHSLLQAWRERNIASIGTAAWNTFAQGVNMYNAFSDVPDAWKTVGDLFSSKGDKDDRKAAMILMIVIVAIAGGALITFLLIQHYAKQNLPQPVPVEA